MMKAYLITAELIIFTFFFDYSLIFLTNQADSENSLYLAARERKAELVNLQDLVSFSSLSLNYIKPSTGALQNSYRSFDLYYYLTKSSKSPPT